MLEKSFSNSSVFPMHEVFPYFQPIVGIDGKVACFETLARMKEGNNVLTPYFFMDKIPDDKQIEFDLHMLGHACAFVCDCADKKLTVNVNFQAKTLAEKDMAQMISNCLKKYNLSPAQIGIEVLEDSFEKDEANILNTLVDLNQVGHPIAIDDLGMGDASIERVQVLKDILKNKAAPLTVKIDMKFGGLLYNWSKSFFAVLTNKVFEGLPIVFEGVSHDAMAIIKQEQKVLQITSPIKFQTFDLFKPMPAAEAKMLLVDQQHEAKQAQKLALA